LKNGSDEHGFVIAGVVFMGYALGAAHTVIRPLRAVDKVRVTQFKPVCQRASIDLFTRLRCDLRKKGPSVRLSIFVRRRL
jgi:hypothetical protein